MVSVSSAAFGSGAARVFALADILSVHHVDFGTTPLDAVRSALFPGNTTVTHGKGRILRAGWIAVNVVADFFEGAFISGIVGNEHF